MTALRSLPVAQQQQLYRAALLIARDRTQPPHTRRRAIQVARFWRALLLRRKLVHRAHLDPAV